MSNCIAQICSAALLAFALALGAPAASRAEGLQAASAGVVVQRSAYGVGETVSRLKADIAAKGIVFFSEIDQSALAAKAGIAGVRPSVLLMFGNPPLGTQFIAANPQAALDWPVRMLVYADASGAVWIAWSDFAWVAQRHGIANLGAQFKMASEVAASIAAAASATR